MYSLFTLRKTRSPLAINGERAFLIVNRLHHMPAEHTVPFFTSCLVYHLMPNMRASFLEAFIFVYPAIILKPVASVAMTEIDVFYTMTMDPYMCQMM